MKAYNTSLFNTKGILKIFNNWIYRQKNVFNATKMTKNFNMRPVIFQKKKILSIINMKKSFQSVFGVNKVSFRYDNENGFPTILVSEKSFH